MVDYACRGVKSMFKNVGIGCVVYLLSWALCSLFSNYTVKSFLGFVGIFSAIWSVSCCVILILRFIFAMIWLFFGLVDREVVLNAEKSTKYQVGNQCIKRWIPLFKKEFIRLDA